MAAAGADIVVCHMGLTTGGSIGAADGAEASRLRRARSMAYAAAAKAVNPDVLVLCHGGPIADAGGRELDPVALRGLPRVLRGGARWSGLPDRKWR
jgi:predicted TIM-barrel enzyme